MNIVIAKMCVVTGLAFALVSIFVAGIEAMR